MAATWLRAEAYPIFVAVGGAVGLCAFVMARTIEFSPDVRISKEERAMGVLEEKRFFKEGAEFREHKLRRRVARHTLTMIRCLHTSFLWQVASWRYASDLLDQQRHAGRFYFEVVVHAMQSFFRRCFWIRTDSARGAQEVFFVFFKSKVDKG